MRTGSKVDSLHTGSKPATYIATFVFPIPICQKAFTVLSDIPYWLFFSCDCLMASMARSVDCLIQKSKRRCTGPFNWGDAHCAGENVKHKTGPFLQKSHKRQANSKQGTARHGIQEPPGQAPRYTGQEATPQTNRDFEYSSRYALTYIERSGTCSNPVMYRDSFHIACEGSRMSQNKLQLSTADQRMN